MIGTERSTILFIDDNQVHFESLFNLAGEQYGIDFIGVDTVREGLETLQDYAGVINGVILDLTFPLDQMQGPEALGKIRSGFPELPVIVLTDSDGPEDLNRVVECMRSGAFNYVGKRELHTSYLMEVVQKAIEHNQLESLNNGRSKLLKEEGFCNYTNETDDSVYRYVAVFGFEMESVNLGNEAKGRQEAFNKAMKWHRDFLMTINHLYIGKLGINLRINYDPPISDEVTLRIFITAWEKKEEGLQRLLRNLHIDLSPFFFNNSRVTDSPYSFIEITSEDELKAVSKPQKNEEILMYYRTPVPIKERTTIGLKPASKIDEKKLEADSGYNPTTLFPLPGKLLLNNDLFEAIISQREKIEIDLQLASKELLPQEIDLIKKLLESPVSMNRVDIPQSHIEAYSLYLEKLLETKNDKFVLSVALKKEGKTYSQYLKNAVVNHFFEPGTSIIEEKRFDTGIDRFSAVPRVMNELPFLFDLDHAFQSFRLPLPIDSKIFGVPTQKKAHLQFPDYLDKNGLLLGQKTANNRVDSVYIGAAQIRRHMYVMGQTGTGKTTLLKSAIKSLLEKGQGFAVIDPHGDLFNEVKDMVGDKFPDSVVVINPSDLNSSLAFNIIDYDERYPEQRSLMINELYKVFDSIYNMSNAGGPMFEQFFRYGMLSVTDKPVVAWNGKATLDDFNKFFFNSDFRNKVLTTCSDVRAKEFFDNSAKAYGDMKFENFAPYITSKINRITEDEYLKKMIVSKENSINFRSIMDEGKIVLVKLDKGKIGSENVSLIGQLLINNIILSSMSRSDIPESDRKAYHVVIDEFQNFTRGDVSSALSELRKYNVSFLLANQTMGQLSDELVQSVFGNVGSMVFFRPGLNDYERIRHYLEPDFEREDVLKLPNFNCIGRLMVDNIPCDPFIFQTIPD